MLLLDNKRIRQRPHSYAKAKKRINAAIVNG